MKRLILVIVSSAVLLASCGSGIETPDEAAATFCDLMTRAAAATGDESDKLMKELDDLENKIEKEHDGDEAWFQEFEMKVSTTCF